jgi:hypothetical protein
MKVYPGDVLKASGSANQAVSVTYQSDQTSCFPPGLGIGMSLGQGEVVLLPPGGGACPTARFSLSPNPDNPQVGELVYFNRPHSFGEMDVFTPLSTINDENTEFEVVGNSTVTTVYVFNGSVQFSNLAWTSNVTVRSSQTATMAMAGLATSPTAFDPTTVNHWWKASTASTSSSNGGGVPEFPYQFVTAAAFTAILVLSYLVVRSRALPRAPVATGRAS